MDRFVGSREVRQQWDINCHFTVCWYYAQAPQVEHSDGILIVTLPCVGTIHKLCKLSALMGY